MPRLHRRILITGATGLIGSELCGELVERGHAVVALIHRRRHLLRNDGRRLHPAPYDGSTPEHGTLHWTAGDIRKANFGMEAHRAALLANTVDLIVHCAAETKFSPASDLHHRINVQGTSNVIEFARSSRGRIPGLVHVSTAYVSGERSGPVSEEELDVGQAFANTYESSKAHAEKLVRESGLRAAIARPSIIVGRSDTGAIGRFENLYGLLRLIGSGRIAVLPCTPDASLDLVPIDHVVGGLGDIVEQLEAATGKTFHLVSGDPAPLASLVALDYPGLCVPTLVDVESFDVSLLAPAERALYDAVTSAYSAYLRRNPQFAARNLPALSGRVCPPTGPGFLRRVVEFAKGAGYLRPNDSRTNATYRTSG